jgi:hypothetical protein
LGALLNWPRIRQRRQECPTKKRGGEEKMLVICVHTWNPKAPGMTIEEFLPRREEFMNDLVAKKVPVKSMQTAMNWEQGKGWCIWETDTIERLEGIMAEFSNIHTDIIPVEIAPQVM